MGIPSYASQIQVKNYLTSYILSSIELTVAKGYDFKILSRDKNGINVEELVNDCNSAPQRYFHLKCESKVPDSNQSASNSFKYVASSITSSNNAKRIS